MYYYGFLVYVKFVYWLMIAWVVEPFMFFLYIALLLAMLSTQINGASVGPDTQLLHPVAECDGQEGKRANQQRQKQSRCHDHFAAWEPPNKKALPSVAMILRTIWRSAQNDRLCSKAAPVQQRVAALTASVFVIAEEALRWLRDDGAPFFGAQLVEDSLNKETAMVNCQMSRKSRLMKQRKRLF